jgi:glucose/arabinose dehydrogenase
MRRIALGVFALAVTVTACNSGSGSEGTQTPTSPSGSKPPSSSASATTSPSPPDQTQADLGAVRLALRKVATLEQPLALAVRTGDSALYVAEKTGRVMAIRDGRVDPTPVLDLSSEVSGGGEQGLLGLAFSPDGRSLYASFTDLTGDTRIKAYPMTGGTADHTSARDVLHVDQPYSNHNGGEVIFGPDGYLYVGLGDGGSEGDPEDRGQALGTLLGKILRIDPRPDGSYSVPGDNPFAARDGARGEIWAYGLRNPWRFSFDRMTGDLWIGDVGQNAWEEVDFRPAGSWGGENYGWSLREGTHDYKGERPPDNVDPIYEYSHDTGGCVVTGGYVYRGQAIPNLQGAYVFADYCLGRITALVQRDGRVAARRTFDLQVPEVASFGEDQNGEIYAMSLEGGVYRLVAG